MADAILLSPLSAGLFTGLLSNTIWSYTNTSHNLFDNSAVTCYLVYMIKL